MKRDTTARGAGIGYALLIFFFWMMKAFAADSNTRPFRFAFSTRMFVDVNENDARAALKIWSNALGQEQGIPVDPETRLLSNKDSIATAILQHEIEAVTITTDEYWVLRNRVSFGPFIMGIKNGQITEEYLILIRSESPLHKIEDLSGRSIAIFENPRASLAPVWLNTILLKGQHDPLDKYFGKVTWVNKLNKVVLPVFFRQIDACLTTRNGFQTMVELNPQLGKQLKIVAQSPPMVPVLFCFRGDYDSPNRDKLRSSIGNIHKTIAGRQTVTLFQTEKLAEHPISMADNAIELLDEYERLCAQKKIPMVISPGIIYNEIKAPTK